MASYSPATWPVPIFPPNLEGSIIQLELLTASHLPELMRIGETSAIWEFTTSRADTPGSMQDYVEGLLQDWRRGKVVPFAVRRIRDGALVGCTRLKELDRNHRHGLIGSWYVPTAWRKGVNVEAKLLLLDFAFRELQCVRVEFHTDACNLRSRWALEKLGAKLEGVLRGHQITRDGRLRDSAVYSILQTEWASIRPAIVARIEAHRQAI